MKKEKPLVEALQQFVEKKPVSMHVPGHKNGLLSNLPKELKTALTYDVTELTGLDDFHHPEEAILEAEGLLAETYQSDRSFFLVNGSTVGNLAMIYATCKKDENIIIQRNAHKSIFHALELVGANAIYVTPEWDEKTKTYTSVSTDTIKSALEIHKNVKAVVLTYPTYYGVASKELQAQIELCHSYNVPVLVDEAHGAHFIANKDFPPSALQLGADIVVQSAHKTLPAMTMASFLHIKSKLVNVEKVNHYLRILQSSSPSYLLLASLDDARHYIQTYLESDAVYFFDRRKLWVEALQSIQSLEVVEVDDPLKLLLRVKGYTGFQLKTALETQKIYVELADTNQVLLILPLLKNGQTYPFADLRMRIKDAVSILKKEPIIRNVSDHTSFEIAKITMPENSFAQVEQNETEWIPYTRSIGRISAGMVIPYPPGIPLFVPGEKITVSRLSQLEELLMTGATFQGTHQLENKLILVIK